MERAVIIRAKAGEVREELAPFLGDGFNDDTHTAAIRRTILAVDELTRLIEELATELIAVERGSV